MSGERSFKIDQLLELLVDEVQDRLLTRASAAETERAVAEELAARRAAAEKPAGVEVPEPRVEPELAAAEEAEGEGMPEPLAAPEEEVPPLAGPSHAAQMMRRLAWGVLAVVILFNIPFDRHGTTLATVLPDAASLIIRDGLVLKEEDDEEIYVYRDGKFRWISSMEAFEHYGFTWGDVHIVADGYLDEFEIGSPIFVLLKCSGSPHIYGLQGGEKRWIRDIETFTAEGYVWEDVQFVSCDYLRELPDGETMPPGSGPPPEP
jgi:hypothetical protein